MPYIKGTSERLQRAFESHEVTLVHKPLHSLRSQLARVKDKTENLKSVEQSIASIPNNANKFVYVSLGDWAPYDWTVFQIRPDKGAVEGLSSRFILEIHARSFNEAYNILFALAVIISIWEFYVKALSVNIAKSLNSLTSLRTVSLKYALLVKGTCWGGEGGRTRVICRPLYSVPPLVSSYLLVCCAFHFQECKPLAPTI